MLAEGVETYLAMRIACGFKMRNPKMRLRSFAKFSAERGHQHVSAAAAIEWVSRAPSVKTRARMLGDIIRFARHARVEDGRHEIPPPIFGSENHLRPPPYIFSRLDIQRLVDAAASRGASVFRQQTYSTFFSLLACTGLRLSEAINLRFQDITPDGLIVRSTKFGKTRLVPLHGTAWTAFRKFLAYRRRYATADDHVFIQPHGRPFSQWAVENEFTKLIKELGLPHGREKPHPTPHSLRHTFAVRSLQRCPSGRDRITRHMVALSNYLGHANVVSTYWYLEATPELMTDISRRCESFVRRTTT